MLDGELPLLGREAEELVHGGVLVEAINVANLVLGEARDGLIGGGILAIGAGELGVSGHGVEYGGRLVEGSGNLIEEATLIVSNHRCMGAYGGRVTIFVEDTTLVVGHNELRDSSAHEKYCSIRVLDSLNLHEAHQTPSESHRRQAVGMDSWW